MTLCFGHITGNPGTSGTRVLQATVVGAAIAIVLFFVF